jgi:hypothetical protein
MRAETISGKVTPMNRLGKLASGMDKVSGVWYKQIQPRRDLLGVASRIPVAVRFHFRRHDITRDSYSFRDFFEKSDFNSHIFNDSPACTQSESSFPFIFPRQWRVLEPLLPPPERRSCRGHRYIPFYDREGRRIADDMGTTSFTPSEKVGANLGDPSPPLDVSRQFGIFLPVSSESSG